MTGTHKICHQLLPKNKQFRPFISIKWCCALYIKLLHFLCDWFWRLWVDIVSSNYLHPSLLCYCTTQGCPQRSVREDVMWTDWKQLKKFPLGFLMQMMRGAERSRRGWKNPDWKVRVCSICYCSSLFINAAERQAESQLVKRYLFDRSKVCFSSPLAGLEVHGGLATVHLQFQMRTQTLLCGRGESITLVDQMALGLCHPSSTSSLWVSQSISHTEEVSILMWRNGNLVILNSSAIMRRIWDHSK